MVLTNLMTQISMIEFYAAKLESYMRRKHDSILKADEFSDTQSTASASRIKDNDEESKSPTPATQSFDEKDNSTEQLVVSDKSPPLGEPLVLTYQSESETDNDHDLEFYDRIQKIKDKTVDHAQNRSISRSVEFKDFMEPHLIKTGHIIPLSCGHNSGYSKTEMMLYEIHLTNAGFIGELEAIVENQAHGNDDLNKTGDGLDDEEAIYPENEFEQEI